MHRTGKFKIFFTCAWLVFLFLGVGRSSSLSAQVIYGFNQYTEYRPGTLPIVISAPHGGSVTPLFLPDRTCNNATTVTDVNTRELALQIDSSFFAQTGCHINLVLCNLKRTKLDCNREIVEAACGNAYAERAWNEYHRFIDSALQLSRDRYGQAFYIDLHGHGHSKQRIELGYGLSASILRNGDATLNTSGNIRLSSIGDLTAANLYQLSHAALVRGEFSLGTLLGNSGYPAVPSSQIKAPDEGDDFYSGGYSVYTHTCINPQHEAIGVQMECYRVGIRDTYINRKAFAEALAGVLTEYLGHHLGLGFNNCGTGVPENEVTPESHTLFPSFCRSGQRVFIQGLGSGESSYELFSAIGQKVNQGLLDPSGSFPIRNGQQPGLYVVKVEIRPGKYHPFRLIITE